MYRRMPTKSEVRERENEFTAVNISVEEKNTCPPPELITLGN
jgi:hypothetical protein